MATRLMGAGTPIKAALKALLSENTNFDINDFIKWRNLKAEHNGFIFETEAIMWSTLQHGKKISRQSAIVLCLLFEKFPKEEMRQILEGKLVSIDAMHGDPAAAEIIRTCLDNPSDWLQMVSRLPEVSQS